MKDRKSSKLIIGIILLAAGIGLLVWTLTSEEADAPAHDHSTHSHDEDEDSDQVNPNDANEQSTVITFQEGGFSPREVTVAKGTTVTVKNNSSNRLQFSSDDHPTHRINQGMNLPVLAPGESDTFTAEEVGEWGFHDHIDASFTGMITVVE